MGAIPGRAGRPPIMRANMCRYWRLRRRTKKVPTWAFGARWRIWGKQSRRILQRKFHMAIVFSGILRRRFHFRLAELLLFTLGATLRSAAGSVVTVAGASDEFASAARGNYIDFDRPESSVLRCVCWIVCERVLMANIVRHLFADGMNLGDACREKCQTARGVGNFLQRLLSFFYRSLVFAGILAQQPDGINHRGSFLKFSERFFEAISAGIVVAIGNHQKKAPVFWGLFQTCARSDDGAI